MPDAIGLIPASPTFPFFYLMHSFTRIRFAGLLLLWLISIIQVQAQATATASIRGTVQAEKGNLLVGTTVAALHLPTGIRRATTTDLQGQFSLETMLPGGPYALQITQPGFRAQVISNVFLSADKPLELAFTLVPAVVAVGTRRLDRTEQDAVAPVDVIDMRELTLSAPYLDNTQILKYVVPSFNANRETSADGGDHVDASSLRGLGSDQVLVLLNGKRRHSSALIHLLGSQSVGSSTTDLNTISANALDRVEILRDGAAAQYGSDAIAGVINFNLKRDSKGGNVLLNNGINSSGFGYNSTLSLNKGLKLGGKGFLNVTGEVDYRGHTTSPNYQRDLRVWPIYSSNAAQEDSFLRANGKTQRDYRQRNGDARITNYRAVFNAGLPLSEKVQLYSFGTYNFRRGQSVAPWVLPSANPADLLPRPGYSLGYEPEINTRIHDGAAVLGLDAKLGGWDLDLSQSFGTNRMAYDLSNTLNPSMGAASPTTFDAGSLNFSQAVSSASLSRLFDKALAGTNVAFGAEFRNDHYEIVADEEASWRDYQQGEAGASGGSQGFIGFDPGSAISGSRQNVAGYLDVEADIVKRWTMGAATRFENYSDFGSAFTYKATTRVVAAKWLALRAAYNTGFRAPSLQQRLYRQLTLLPTAGGTTYSGIYNNDDDIARTAGISKLRAERSNNLSGGLVLTPAKNLVLTADAYLIDIDNRITRTNEFGAGISPEFDAALQQAQTTSVQFFANALDTRTRGLDLVGNYTIPLGRNTLRLGLAANLNETKLRDIQVPTLFQGLQTDGIASNDFIGQRQLSLITTGSPRSKMLATVGFEGNKFGATLRATRFGEVSMYDYNFENFEEGSYFFVFSPKTVTDLILTYKATKGLLLALGANNVFNVRPDDVITAAKNGRAPQGYSSMAEYEAAFPALHGGVPSYLPSDRDIFPYQMVQMGANGTFVYLKASYSFGL